MARPLATLVDTYGVVTGSVPPPTSSGSPQYRSVNVPLNVGVCKTGEEAHYGTLMIQEYAVRFIVTRKLASF